MEDGEWTKKSNDDVCPPKYLDVAVVPIFLLGITGGVTERINAKFNPLKNGWVLISAAPHKKKDEMEDGEWTVRIGKMMKEADLDQSKRIALGTLCDGLYLLPTSPKHTIRSATT
nr:hypothetical protein [Tanacetum cinerariifolium]